MFLQRGLITDPVPPSQLGSATTAIFGGGVWAIVQGFIGIIASLEGFFAATQQPHPDRTRVCIFAGYLVANTIARWGRSVWQDEAIM